LFLGKDIAHVVELDNPPGALARLLSLNGQISDVAKWAQCLTPEAHCLDSINVIKLTDFGGSTPFSEDVKVYLLDPAPIIHDLKPLQAVVVEFDV